MLIFFDIQFISFNNSNNSMYNTTASTCVCTTVPCPVVGTNTLTLSGGGKMSYNYVSHNGVPVVASASGTISTADLDKGNEYFTILFYLYINYITNNNGNRIRYYKLYTRLC